MDDLIDATGAAGEAGKDVGKDLKKTTFVSFSGVEGARQLAGELIDASEAALRGFGARAQPLRDLARYVWRAGSVMRRASAFGSARRARSHAQRGHYDQMSGV